VPGLCRGPRGPLSGDVRPLHEAGRVSRVGQVLSTWPATTRRVCAVLLSPPPPTHRPQTHEQDHMIPPTRDFAAAVRSRHTGSRDSGCVSDLLSVLWRHVDGPGPVRIPPILTHPSRTVPRSILLQEWPPNRQTRHEGRDARHEGAIRASLITPLPCGFDADAPAPVGLSVVAIPIDFFFFLPRVSSALGAVLIFNSGIPPS